MLAALADLRTRAQAWSSGYNRVRPTLAGGWFLAILIGVTLAALNTGNNLVYMVLATLLAVLVVNNVLAEWNLRGLAVDRVLPAEVFAGAPALGALVLINRRRLGDAWAVEVHEQDGGGARALFDRVPARGRREVAAPWTFPERGVSRFSMVRVGSSFPFGLLRRWRDVPVPGEVLVYPEIGREAPPAATSGQGAGAASRGGADDTGELVSLRPYTVGDPVRRIHWGISARLPEPVVVLRAGERGSEVMVVVDGGGARESAIRRACGRVVWHCARGDAVGLLADGQEIPVSSGAAHRRRLLTRLALLPGPSRGSAA